MVIFAASLKTDSKVSQKSNPASTKTIYIIRHGQTEFNKKGIVQGSGVDTDLNETGTRQAHQFFNHYRHIPFSRVYVSALKRTHQTVEEFIKIGIPQTILVELNEINWGKMEGVEPTPESHKMFVETLEKWQQGFLDVAAAGGESPNELYDRQKNGLAKIMAATDEDPVLICMHGRAMRSFLCLLTGTPLQQMDDFEHGNVCLYVLEKKADSPYFEIVLRNSRLHLHESFHT
jgi:probable phosphoglycerate mutase